MKLINRQSYLDRLMRVRGTPDIKVITGVRRSGKSKLLQIYMDWLRENDPEAQIVWLNLQEVENEAYLDYRALHDFVMESYREGKNNYLFIDEVQLCSGFEKAINSLHAKEIYDIYVTGSNAFLLSSDLATLFTGRTFSIHVYPFSFKEFLQYYEREDIDPAFDDYLKFGGFAGSYAYSQLEDRYNYIKNEVFNTIVTRDIMQKYEIRNESLFLNVSNYLIDNISNLTSSRSIQRYMTSNKEGVSHNTISNYIDYLTRAFIFYELERYDIKGKRYLATEQKYYLVDHAIKYAILGSRNQDLGRVLENIVYMELRRRGYEAYIGKLYQKEVDFVALKRDKKFYIQVSTYIQDDKTLERELAPLLAIQDAYPKLIIARTHQEEYSIEGVRVLDIASWLSGKEDLG